MVNEGAPQHLPRILPMGERAVLVELEQLSEVLALRARLAATQPDGVTDLVPAARTVLVQFDPAMLADAQARAWIAAAAREAQGVRGDHGPPTRRASQSGPAHLIDIRYDGPDLDEVAASLGITPKVLIARHAAASWTVAFTGFAPGFGYLVSDDWPLDIPRKRNPRTAVPAGSLGLAAEFSGVYPRETPGGWQLIGTTTTRLFRPELDEPALLAPGDTVRFRVIP